MAAGRLQGEHDAMATASISNFISSLLFHFSLLNPEAGNAFIWKEHRMACGCYADSNGTLPNGPDCHKGNCRQLTETQTSRGHQEPSPLTWPSRAPGPGESPAAAWQPGSLHRITPTQAAWSGPQRVLGRTCGQRQTGRPFRRPALGDAYTKPQCIHLLGLPYTGTQPARLSG